MKKLQNNLFDDELVDVKESDDVEVLEVEDNYVKIRGMHVIFTFYKDSDTIDKTAINTGILDIDTFYVPKIIYCRVVKIAKSIFYKKVENKKQLTFEFIC